MRLGKRNAQQAGTLSNNVNLIASQIHEDQRVLPAVLF